MSKPTPMKPLALALGAAFVTSLAGASVANAAENPFGMTELSSGYMVAETGMKEGNCGANKAKEMKDGKCGTGKCGANMKQKQKMHDGKCGSSMSEEKMKEGNCGGSMKHEKTEMPKEGNCGGSK